MDNIDSLMNPIDGDIEVLQRPDGTRLRCFSAGEGPTVVLAHGWLGNLTSFNLVSEGLVANGYRVIAFDQRGHGESTVGADGMSAHALAGDYRALLEHYDVRDGVLVGHSMGAFLSVVFSLQHPDCARERLRAMLLLGGHAGDILKGSLPNRIQIPMTRWGLIKLTCRSKRLSSVTMRPLFGEKPKPEYVEVCRLGALATVRKEILGILDAMCHEEYYSRLNEIEVETLVLCGERDQTCPRWHSERLGNDIPNARNRWLPGIGHMYIYECPDVVVSEIEALAS